MVSDGDSGEALGLVTRHVFLDTAIYRSYGHDLTRPPLAALGGHLSNEFLILHITDITLSEIERQLNEDAKKTAAEVTKIRRSLERWNSLAPRAVGACPDVVDAGALANAAFTQFRHTIYGEWNAQTHAALDLPAAPVFERYFGRQSPFDEDKSSKEFPDAFVVAALTQHCKKEKSSMYIVTPDLAMQRAARDSGVLIPIGSLEDLLQIAAAAETPEVIERVKRILDSPEFLLEIEKAIKDQIGNLGLIYVGDLDDGEATGAEVAGEPDIEDFSVLSASPERISVFIVARVPLLVDVTYEDLSSAS